MDETTPLGSWLDRIDQLAREHPQVTALVMAGKSPASGHREVLSWHDLAWRSAGVAYLFAERGVTLGCTVAIQLPSSVPFVLAALAAWRLGATVVPIRWDLSAEDRAQLVAMARPLLIVTADGAGADEIAGVAVAQAPPVDPATLPCSLIAAPAWMTASEALSSTPTLVAPKVTTALGSASGMGLVGGRSSFADNSHHRHPVHLVCTPLYQMQGFALLFRALIEDFRVILMERFEPEPFLDLVERERVNFVALVPDITMRLLKSPTIVDRDLTSIENVILGAGATPDWAIRALIELTSPETIKLGYGMSEGVAAAFLRGDEWLQHPGSVGKPSGVETLIVDAEGHTVPPGEEGELFFRPLGGTGDSFKYVAEDETHRLPGGWTSSGDHGRVDLDGYLYITDRGDDALASGGNVFVSEVEAALLQHSDVADVAVIGLPDPEWQRRVHAIVQLRPGVDAAGMDTALRAHAKQHLAAHKTPQSYEYVAELAPAEGDCERAQDGERGKG